MGGGKPAKQRNIKTPFAGIIIPDLWTMTLTNFIFKDDIDLRVAEAENDLQLKQISRRTLKVQDKLAA